MYKIMINSNVSLYRACRVLALTTLVVVHGLGAQENSAEVGVTDRPSASRPELPAFIPEQAPTPGISVPSLPSDRASSAPPSSSPAAGPRFEFTGFHFDGNQVFSDEQLQAIAAPFVGRPIGIADLEELRHRLTLLYVNGGYINSGAILPDQRVKDGTLTYRIIEGRISRIDIQGNGGLDPDYITDRMRLGSGPPLQLDALQERFQLLLEDPLIEQLNGSLGPGTQPGESRLDLKVKRAKPYDITFSADNYLPPSIGAIEGRLDITARNLTGYGDALSLLARKGSGSWGFNGRFSIPVTASGTRVWLRVESTDSSIIEERLKALDIESRIRGVEVGIRHPVYRSLVHSLSLGAALAIRRNESTLLDAPFSFTPGSVRGRSKLAALRLLTDYEYSSKTQVFSARSTVSIGLDAFNATDNDNGLPDGQFVAWLGQTQYARRILDNGAQLVARADLQLSSDNLLAMEQIPLGGRYTVRGYRENELVRDQGVIASIEFRYPLSGPNGILPLPGRLQIAPFVDYGYGWNKKDIIGLFAEGEQLLSAGVGLYWTLPSHAYAELFWGHAFINAPDFDDHDLQDDGFHFRLSWSY